MICVACGLTRDPADLLVFWRVAAPETRRFVCRPTRPVVGSFGPCFVRSVGSMSVHAIALAAPIERRTDFEPIRPGTFAWGELLRDAGVRAA